jgi:hypothetical protein
MLDLYAAGALTPPEQEEVERMAAQYPEVKEELEQIRADLEKYARLHAVKPRPELKEQILRGILGEEGQEEARTIPFVPAPAPADAPPEPEHEGKVIPMDNDPLGKFSKKTFNLALTAAVALILISNVISFWFFQNWKHTESRLEAALTREQQLAQTFRTMESQLGIRDQDLAVVRDPQFQPVPLQGLEVAPEASIIVYWNPETAQVFLDVRVLPPPPSGFQYQLWALDNGQPVNAGVIPVDNVQLEHLQRMQTVRQAQGFAVTLEPEGGSESPTLDKMYLMGNV